jgi:hypothetical protein
MTTRTWAPLYKKHNRHHHPDEPCPYCKILELEEELILLKSLTGSPYSSTSTDGEAA